MRQATFFQRALMAFLLFFALSASAQQDIKNPREVIQESTSEVLDIIQEHQTLDERKMTQAMADELLQTLEPAVDFDAIARGVMGKHGKQATQQQKQEFSAAFKRSLSKLYMKSFQTFEVKSVEVLPLPDDFSSQNDTRAYIKMKAQTGNNKVYSIDYSMGRKDSSKPWQVHNIILDGVNLGLVYMNQFDGAVSRHGSIDAAIANWSSEEIKKVDEI
ncbi:phospholipid-binding protein MlaC [Methylophaga sp.]|jgi:phospholipid transport system substrate-binding protein|uniref:MlaC/ttg2D family ABC transporter substrate-binding protein n=1 Tax=Methylophaga sp. TaxID=2024840 RepID=UPI0014005B3E|nr:ABC transporter substrate-binding protein [Methylophaga sp.]MTI64794.1 ABC transporter substrate-binding protein [Methylophaga sp.]